MANPTEERDRRPKCLRYEAAAGALEQMIVDALPGIDTKLISMANEGNMDAARYLIDRIHGRPACLAAAPTVDSSLTYTHFDMAADQLKRKAQQDARADLAMFSIANRQSNDRPRK